MIPRIRAQPDKITPDNAQSTLPRACTFRNSTNFPIRSRGQSTRLIQIDPKWSVAMLLTRIGTTNQTTTSLLSCSDDLDWIGGMLEAKWISSYERDLQRMLTPKIRSHSYVQQNFHVVEDWPKQEQGVVRIVPTISASGYIFHRRIRSL